MGTCCSDNSTYEDVESPGGIDPPATDYVIMSPCRRGAESQEKLIEGLQLKTAELNEDVRGLQQKVKRRLSDCEKKCEEIKKDGGRVEALNLEMLHLKVNSKVSRSAFIISPCSGDDELIESLQGRSRDLMKSRDSHIEKLQKLNQFYKELKGKQKTDVVSSSGSSTSYTPILISRRTSPCVFDDLDF